MSQARGPRAPAGPVRALRNLVPTWPPTSRQPKRLPRLFCFLLTGGKNFWKCSVASDNEAGCPSPLADQPCLQTRCLSGAGVHRGNPLPPGNVSTEAGVGQPRSQAPGKDRNLRGRKKGQVPWSLSPEARYHCGSAHLLWPIVFPSFNTSNRQSRESTPSPTPGSAVQW